MARTRQAERPWVNCSILLLYVRKLRRSISGYGRGEAPGSRFRASVGQES
jgi:hypothetical protein